MHSGTLELTPLNVPALDTQLAIDYWIGSRPIAVDDPDTICASINPYLNFYYVAPNWVERQTLWKSASHCELWPFVNRVNLVTPPNNMRTISPFIANLRAFEISGDSQSYFLSSSDGWSRYVGGNTWAPLDIDPLWRLVPSFHGTAVCGISPNGNSIKYITDRSVTIDITGTGPTFAAIGNLLIIGRGSDVFSFAYDDTLREIKRVVGNITGVFADDTSVWVGTDAQNTYLSLNRGQEWLEIANARAVTPWLVIRDGHFFTVQYTPPNPGNPGDGNPGDGNPGDGNPGDGNPGDGNPPGTQPGDTPASSTSTIIGVIVGVVVVAIVVGLMIFSRSRKPAL